MPRRRIWIDDGCIQCGWCQNLVPQVFIADGAGTRIAGVVRADGVTSDNRRERSLLRHGKLPPEDLAFMPFVADGCPPQVIHLEGWDGLGVADPALTIR